MIGEGSVDLSTESLDIELTSYPRKGIGGLTVNPGGFLSSFKLVGTLRNPSLALEPTDTVIAVGKAVGGFLLFGPAGLLAGMISDTKGADAVCIARP